MAGSHASQERSLKALMWAIKCSDQEETHITVDRNYLAGDSHMLSQSQGGQKCTSLPLSQHPLGCPSLGNVQ